MLVKAFFEQKKTLTRSVYSSGSRTRTYDIMINSHALLPTCYRREKAVS